MPQRIPQVIFAPQSRNTLKSGFDQMARLLAQTLGPTQGIVFHATAQKPTPEPLTDSATIARRIIALPDRAQNVGGMLLRNLVWRVHQRVGDGGATTAVLAQAILEQANRYVVAGANPVRVQAGIQKASARAVAALKQMASPAHSQEELALVAYAATHEPALSFVLGEMFDLLGEHAHVMVEEYVAPYLEREYISGGRWQAKLISPYLISSPGSGKAVARDCNVVLFNGNLTTAEEVLPLLRLLGEKEQKNLLLVAQKISGEALNTLVATYSQNKKTLEFVVVDLVRAGEKALSDMQDLALLTGAKLFDPHAGDRLASIKPAEMGMAQRAEANAENLFVTGGKGDAAALREQISTLDKYLGSLAFDDNQVTEIKTRLGRLSGSSGILKIGAHSKRAGEVLRQKAQQGLRSAQAALQAGILPGGGSAFLHCIPLVESLECADEDEQMGCRAVARALRRPFEQMLENAGVPYPGRLAHEILSAPPGLVFDIRQRKIRPALEAGVLDAAQVLCVSLETAASGAQMALSTEVIILKRKPRTSYQP